MTALLRCTLCGAEKAKSQLYKLGLTPEPVCKACHAKAQMSDLEREVEAITIAARTLEVLPRESQVRALSFLTLRYGAAGAN